MRKLLILTLCLLLHTLSFEQLSKGGTPPGIERNSPWVDVPLYEMPQVDVARLLAEDSLRELDKTKPVRFGKATVVSIVPAATNGRWQTLPGENRLWQQRIRSAGAFSLSIGFRNMKLPAGSRLFIYNRDRTTVLGAFTPDLAYTDGILATEQLNGDEVLVEYEVPARYMNEVPFELYRVSHDYRNINKILQSFGQAGACQTNINCPVGANYQDVKKGVAAIISSGSELCTGTLINTTNNSGIPYFLTANHCYDNNTANWVFRFNWESPTCANPATSPTYQSLSGSTLKARSAATDFCLVQLTNTPPANYNVAYVGWDKSGNTPASQTCVSHPSIDIKKICTAADPATTATYSGATCWQTGTWANGCPEPGSSGSALLDQNKRIVGQLFGGPSACGQPASSMHDFYGKFSLSWTGGGTSATRLKDWLDPLNYDANTTNLYDPNATVLPLDAWLYALNIPTGGGSYCSTAITPNITLRNNGSTTLTSATISYRVDNSSITSYNWTGNLVTGAITSINLPQFTSTVGTHSFITYTSLPNGGTDGNRLNDTARAAFTLLNTTLQSLPFTESFEGATFPPVGWIVSGPADTAKNWKRGTVGYTGTGSAFKNNFDPGNLGQEDNLTSPFFNFPFATGNYWLSFRVAYAPYTPYADSLKVAVSTDCGATWNIIYRKGGNGLATAPATTDHFVPTVSQWRNDSVSLNAFRGMGPLRIRFINYNDYGNDIYVDDINVSGTGCPGSPIAYVDSAKAVSGNGTSWATAFRTLQEGLEAAHKCPAVTQVWVKKGTYYPATLARDSAFLIQRNGIKLYGGFGGTDTTMATRKPGAYPTVLSGETGGSTTGDNSYHIALIVASTGATIDTSTRIDGFVLQGGNANSSNAFQAAGQTLYHDNGGGIYCYGQGGDNSCKPLIANCTFYGNRADNRGGAIFNEGYNGGNSSPLIVNCSFFGNNAGYASGGGGGAVYNNANAGTSSPSIINCSFYGNTANGGTGGGVYNYGAGAVPVITNSIIYLNNNNTGNSNVSNVNGATFNISYSIVQGGPGGSGNINANPLFVDAAAGNLRLQQCSPAINTGNAAALPAGITSDITGAARLFNAMVDMGAYECTLLPTIFTFKGAGNWNVIGNWQCNWVPPLPLPAASEIVIDPVGGDCILNVPYTVGNTGKLTVKTGKKLVVQGNIQLQ